MMLLTRAMSIGLLLVVLVTGGGCAGLPSGRMSAEVEMVSVAPGGKALLLVRPNAHYGRCVVDVGAEEASVAVDCDAQYLVGCDAAGPSSEPFCRLVREVGPVRDSAYPEARR